MMAEGLDRGRDMENMKIVAANARKRKCDMEQDPMYTPEQYRILIADQSMIRLRQKGYKKKLCEQLYLLMTSDNCRRFKFDNDNNFVAYNMYFEETVRNPLFGKTQHKIPKKNTKSRAYDADREEEIPGEINPYELEQEVLEQVWPPVEMQHPEQWRDFWQMMKDISLGHHINAASTSKCDRVLLDWTTNGYIEDDIDEWADEIGEPAHQPTPESE